MKKKNKTRDVIIVMVIATVIISGILIMINVLSGKANSDTPNVTSQRQWAEVSDNVKNLVQRADMEVKYIGSEKRMVIYLIGSETYAGLMYNPDQKCLYILEGEYTAAATTDALKLSEANSTLNTTSGFVKFAENVSSFVVNGYDGEGYFPDGKIEVTLAVDIDGKMTRNTFTVDIPQAEVAE